MLVLAAQLQPHPHQLCVQVINLPLTSFSLADSLLAPVVKVGAPLVLIQGTADAGSANPQRVLQPLGARLQLVCGPACMQVLEAHGSLGHSRHRVNWPCAYKCC